MNQTAPRVIVMESVNSADFEARLSPLAGLCGVGALFDSRFCDHAGQEEEPMKLLAALSMVLVTAIGWSSAQAQDQHGAIAFSQEANGGYNWGLSWNHEGRDAARSANPSQWSCRFAANQVSVFCPV